MTRKFIKVTVTAVRPPYVVEVAHGIKPFRRGDTITDFIARTMEERSISEYAVFTRGTAEEQTYTVPVTIDATAFSFHFAPFDEADLAVYLHDLSPQELERDRRWLT